MSLPSDPARTEVLARIADALGPAPAAVDVPRDYDIDPPADVDLLERFVDRVEDYRATVHRVGSDDLAETIGRILAAAVPDRVVRVVVAHDLDEAVRGGAVTDEKGALAALLKAIHLEALRENARGHALAIAAA